MKPDDVIDEHTQNACDEFFADFRTEFIGYFRADYDTNRANFEKIFAATWQALVLEALGVSEKHVIYGTPFHTTILETYGKQINEVFRPFLLEVAQRGIALKKTTRDEVINYTYEYCLRAVRKLVPPQIQAVIDYKIQTGASRVYP